MNTLVTRSSTVQLAAGQVAMLFAMLCVLPLASAQVNIENALKASPQILHKMATGVPQNLLVVFDDKAIQKETEDLQKSIRRPSHDRQIIARKALRYTEKKQQVLSSIAPQDATELKRYSHLPISYVRINSKQALDKLLAQPGVVSVFEDRLERPLLAESLPLIGQPQAAAQGNLGTGTTVVVMDGGVDYTQPALGSCTSAGVPSGCKVVVRQDFANKGGVTVDSHGTNVAAIVAGVAPGAKIAALDVLGSAGTASGTVIIDAINWSIANKATYNIVAINLSLGSGSYSSPVVGGFYNAAVDQARAAGILTVAASGNDGYSSALSSPAATSGIVSVGAVYDASMGGVSWGGGTCSDTTTAADKVGCFSNSASFLTLLAPGAMIKAAGISMGGTSQASPHVAGAVAVLRAAFSNDSLDQTVSRLTSGVSVTDARNGITKPRLHLPTALAASLCSYTFSSSSATVSVGGGSASMTVTAGSGCAWTSSSNASWIAVTAGSSGSSNGTVTFSVSANSGTTSRSGTLTIAGKTFTVNQSGTSGSQSGQLVNTGFESGAVSWTQSSSLIITNDASKAQAGSWLAWLGGLNTNTDTLYQNIEISASAQQPSLRFGYRITTSETTTTTMYDTMTVDVMNASTGAKLATLVKYSNLNKSSSWAQSPSYDLSAYKGQTIRLQFKATTDSSNSSSFYIDEVSLTGNGTSVTPQAGWWWNPAEGGRGFTIEQQGNNMFMAGYMYDASGRAAWYAAGPNAMSGTTFSAPLTQYNGGQTLVGTYKSVASTSSVGSVSITFSDSSHGSMTWAGTVVPIQRFDFGAGGAAATPAAGTPESGWWWNAAEGGRGFSIEIQNGTMFLAGYMYDDAGNPIWYASGPTAMANTTTYQGNWQQYGGGQTLAGTYKSASVVNANVGAVTIVFSSTTTATMTLPDGRQIALTRFSF